MTSRSSKISVSESNPVQFVQIDGLVVLKIINHCEEDGAGGTELVQGVLLGLVDCNCLEVTNCFPIPRHSEDDKFDGEMYQMKMMRNMRHVNIDHLHVGWYQSSMFDSFINKPLLESQFTYQNSIEESIVLIYDPVNTGRGSLSLKAYRLTPTVMELYKDMDFSPEVVKRAGLSFEKMFHEIPITIRNSLLTNALLCEMDEMAPSTDKYQFMDLATSSVLEKNVRLLIDSVDELAADGNKKYNYQRQLARQQQARQQWIQKRQAENAARQAQGKLPLPEDDVNKFVKLPQAPARLDALLAAAQIATYSSQITEFASQSFGKLLIAESLQDSLLANIGGSSVSN